MKKFPIPASIKIIGKTYRLEFVPPAPLAARARESLSPRLAKGRQPPARFPLVHRPDLFIAAFVARAFLVRRSI